MLKIQNFILALSFLAVACGPTEPTTPTPEPSKSPSPQESTQSTPIPTPVPTPQPTTMATPTPQPTANATSQPTAEPTPFPTALPEKTNNDLGMDFVKIKAGTFLQGSPSDEVGRDSDEAQRSVTLTKDYLIQTTEVTQRQWESIMGTNPSLYQTPENLERPVENISYDDVKLFIQKLNTKTQKTYRLPTEAEWEHAVRGDSQGEYTFGANHRFLDAYAWYSINAAKDEAAPQTVGLKRANSNGLYDVHGNVSEYVQDLYATERGTTPVTDPQGPGNSALRIYKGGDFLSIETDCRIANRNLIRPDFASEGKIGFRLVLE